MDSPIISLLSFLFSDSPIRLLLTQNELHCKKMTTKTESVPNFPKGQEMNNTLYDTTITLAFVECIRVYLRGRCIVSTGSDIFFSIKNIHLPNKAEHYLSI